MRYLYLLALLCLLAGCNQKENSQKLGANDPFKSTMVPSEFFTVNADRGTVIEGANGTTIALPKGCFKDKNGNVVSGNVKVELAEALALDKMLASNLTTTSDGKPLETGGMIYFKATQNGEELFVNKNKPVYIEIPSEQKRGGMLVYRGVRDDKGNMNWIKPKPTAVFLTPVDINKLDFLPEGFETMTKSEMPLAGHKIATKDFVDSLYYSFSSVGNEDVAMALVAQSQGNAGKMNEPYYNPNKQIVNGAYTKESYDRSNKGSASSLLSDTSSTISEARTEGSSEHQEIDPTRIKALKDPKFNHTLIATKEFEERLKYIFKTCNKDILEIYVKNLDRNMWELDQMAADKMSDDPIMARRFKNFAALKLTNVKDAPEQVSQMTAYYEQQLAKNKEELQTLYNKQLAIKAAKQQEADSMRDAYEKLLWKREKYRMERYGFTWTDNGWVNVDKPVNIPVAPNGIAGEDLNKKLEVQVDDARSFDRVHVYVIFEDINSLYKLNTDNNILHYVGGDDHKMIMYKDKKAVIITVAYKKDTIPYLGIKSFVTGKTEFINTSVSRSSLGEVARAMKEVEKGNYDPKKIPEERKDGDIHVSKPSNYAEENSVIVDLTYQSYFHKEEKRQEQMQREQRALDHLYAIVYPCKCHGGSSCRTQFVSQ